VPIGNGRRFLNGAPGVVNLILGGWQTNWIAVFQTGQFFTPSFSGSDPSNTNTSGGLPDRIADGNYPPENRKTYNYFDASAFKAPPAGRFGNSGVNILEAPGSNLHHLSVVKQFSLTERIRLVYLANFTDIFNTPRYNAPFSNISVPAQVGQVSSVGSYWGNDSGRRISMRLRLEF
jgi:hypothetical protein